MYVCTYNKYKGIIISVMIVLQQWNDYMKTVSHVFNACILEKDNFTIKNK